MSVNISAKEVNELRQKTGSGMMDCKKALVEAGGDFDKAIDILRKKGQKVSAARSNRETSEGVVIYKLTPNEDKASILSFTCETDFVAKNEDFISFVKELSELNNENNSVIEKLKEAKMKNGQTVDDNLVALIAKIGEKITIGKAKTI